jgi:hypothetical protein
MKNGEVNTFLICTVVLSFATGMSITLIQTGYSWGTYMTFHNLADQPSQLSIADVGSTCTAQVNSNCEAGADYVWYTIDVFTPPQDQQKQNCSFNPTLGENVCTYPGMIQKLGVYGHCDVYVTGSNGNYDVDHHCTAADAAGLKPPQNMTNMTARTNTTSNITSSNDIRPLPLIPKACMSCGGSNITSSISSSSAKINLEEGIKALQSGDKQGAMTHLNAAKQAMTNASPEAIKHFEEGMKALAGGDINGAITEFHWNNTIP